MLLDFGWSELMLIGIVALVFIGPKDLPKALRVAGFWVRKARTLSREFQSSVEQMIREAELDEVRQELKKASEIDLDKEFRQAVDPTGSLCRRPEAAGAAEFLGAAAAESGAVRPRRKRPKSRRRTRPLLRSRRRTPSVTISPYPNPKARCWTTTGRPSSKRAECRSSIT